VNRISAKLRKKAQRIKLLLLDADGALTDGGIVYVTEGGDGGRYGRSLSFSSGSRGSGTS